MTSRTARNIHHGFGTAIIPESSANRKLSTNGLGGSWHRLKSDAKLALMVERSLLGRRGELKCRGLLPPPRLDLDIYVDQRNGRRGNSGNARGLAKRLRDDFPELLLHFARQTAHRAVVEPIRNAPLLGLLQAVNGALLLVEVSGIFNFSFDGLELVPDFRREMMRRNINRRGRRVRRGSSCKEPRQQILEN